MAYVPGMENVVAVQTAISHIDGQNGRLIYRGYDISELVFNHSFEAIWHLLLFGELPTSQQLADLKNQIYQYKTLPESVMALIQTASKDTPFISVVRSALSMTFTEWGLQASMDLSLEQLREDCIKVAAIMPVVIAACHRIRQDQAVVTTASQESWPAYFLEMLTGQMPDADQMKVITRYMTLVADHGLNASTFTARVVASTGADVGACVVAAIGALSGPLHGGAPSLVSDMLDEIGSVDKTEAWVTEKIQTGGKIMGFGHRVYKTYDPRSMVLRQTAHEVGSKNIAYAEAVEDIITRKFDELKPGRGIYPNVEYYSAIALEAAGLPRELFTPTFVIARTIGWTAHIYEQATNNRIMRPTSEYIGADLRPVPIG